MLFENELEWMSRSRVMKYKECLGSERWGTKSVWHQSNEVQRMLVIEIRKQSACMALRHWSIESAFQTSIFYKALTENYMQVGQLLANQSKKKLLVSPPPLSPWQHQSNEV